jgi:hypothetical protein
MILVRLLDRIREVETRDGEAPPVCDEHVPIVQSARPDSEDFEVNPLNQPLELFATRKKVINTSGVRFVADSGFLGLG